MKNIRERRYWKDKRKLQSGKESPVETSLWRALQNNQLNKRTFCRHYSMRNYVLDFYCPQEKLAVEIDVGYPVASPEYAYQLERSTFLHSEGVKVMRFKPEEVSRKLPEVVQEIKKHFKPGGPPSVA